MSGATWTQKDDDYLTSHMHMTDKWLAEQLGRSIFGIQNRRCDLRQLKPPRHSWIAQPVTLSDVDRAWIACAIDCEGTLSIAQIRTQKSNHAYALRPLLGFYNTNLAITQHFAKKLGRHFSSYQPRYPNALPAFKIQIYNRALIHELLSQIKDILIVKKRHAQLLLEFIHIRETKYLEIRHFRDGVPYGGREWEILAEMRELNVRKGHYNKRVSVSPNWRKDYSETTCYLPQNNNLISNEIVIVPPHPGCYQV